MNTKQFISKLFAIFAMVAVFQACVEDDDYDTPPIVPDAAENACLFENFEDSATLSNYHILSTGDEDLTWSADTFSENTYLRASAFNKGNVETWFIAGVNFDVATGFSFETLSAYYTGDVLSVYYSTDYNPVSGNPNAATWTDITSNFKFSQSADGFDANWVPSGLYEFSGLSGNGFVAIKYAGSGDGATTLMEIDNFMLVSEDGSGTCNYALPTAKNYKSKGGSEANAVNCLSEDFEAYDDETNDFKTYENIAYTGNRFWETDSFSGNKFLKMSAFKATSDVKSYFVVPVDFDKADAFSFKTQDRYNNGTVLNVSYTTDYTLGGDIETATLTDITSSFTIASGTTGGASQPFVESGSYDLTSITGQGYIVFNYTGNGTGATTTMHIDDIMISDADDTDCTATGGGNTGETCFTDDFESYTKGDTEVTGYQLISEEGKNTWNINEYSNNKYIQVSAYQGDATETDWFILGVNFDVATTFSFDSKDGFNKGDVLKVLYSTNYDATAGMPASATWTDITSSFNIATGSNSGFASEFTASGDYDLTSLTGNGYIAFKYEGDSSKTTTYQIDNIAFGSAAAGNCRVELTQPTTTGGDTFETKGGDSATPLACLNENFEAFADDTEEFSAYENIAYVGGRFWQTDSYDDNRYIKLSAYQADGEVKSYFVVPVNFDTADTFSFKTQDRFNKGNVLTVHYTTNYTIGNDIEAATLTDITSNFTIASGTTDGNSQPFVESGEYDLSSISGNGYIVFRYLGNGTDLTTTMHIDDIMITDTDDSNCNGGDVDPDPTTKVCASEDFEAYDANSDAIAGYQLISEEGKNKWEVKAFDDNKYIQTRGYNGDATEADWFIMGVNFDVATTFSFDSKDGFNNGEGLTVLYSTNYDAAAGTPASATWTDITSSLNIATGTSSGFASEFTASGDYDLSSLSGNGYIAFKFTGGTDSFTTTYQIDNIVINSANDGNCKVDLPAPTTGGGDPDPNPSTGIVNGSFENWTAGVLDNWSSEDGTTITEETTTVAEGSKSAKVEVNTKSQSNTDMRQTVSVEAGKTYTISIQVYQLDNGSRARLFVDGYRDYSDPETLNAWQTISFDYEASETKDIDLGLRFYDTSNFDTKSTMFIDDFKMIEK